MEKPLAVTFAGAPATAAESFKEVMGVSLTMGGHTFTAAEHLLILAAAAVLFSLLSLWSLSRKKK